MKFSRFTVKLVAIIMLLAIAFLVIYTSMKAFGLLDEKVEYPPFEYPKENQ